MDALEIHATNPRSVTDALPNNFATQSTLVNMYAQYVAYAKYTRTTKVHAVAVQAMERSRPRLIQTLRRNRRHPRFSDCAEIQYLSLGSDREGDTIAFKTGPATFGPLSPQRSVSFGPRRREVTVSRHG